MDVLRRSGKETRYGGKEIIPGTKFGLKYNSARRRTQEMPTTSEERRPLADIGNITHLSSQTHASTYEDESSRFIKDQDEVEVEEQVTKASKNILKKRLEITGLLHPDDLIPRRRKKAKEKKIEKTLKKGVGREEARGCEVVSQVRNKQRLMYGNDEDENREYLEQCLQVAAHHHHPLSFATTSHHHPLYSTTTSHHPRPYTSTHSTPPPPPPTYTSTHLSHHQPTTWSPRQHLCGSAGPAMYPLHQTSGATATPWYRGEEVCAASYRSSLEAPSSSRGDCHLLADEYKGECALSRLGGARVHDTDQEPHGEIQQGWALDSCEPLMLHCNCGTFGDGCSVCCLRPPLPANFSGEWRALSTITPCSYSPHTLEAPLSGTRTPFSMENSHPYTCYEKRVDCSSICAPQSNEFFHRPSCLAYSRQGTDFSHIVNSSHSLHNLNNSLSAAEYTKEISNEISHSGYGSSLVSAAETKWVKSQSPGFPDTEKNISNPLRTSSSALNSPGSSGDFDARICRKRRPVTPYPDRLAQLDRVCTSCRPSSTHSHHGCTTSRAPPELDNFIDSVYQHDIMRDTENLPACGEQKCCASPDLFSSQDVTSPAPPSPILQSGSSHEGKHQRVCDTPRRCDYHTLRESQANAKPPQQDESRPSTLNDDHLRPDSTDTTNESNLRFSPKISLTCTEDSYLAGVTGMVRVSTVEGEMVLNPSSWKLAHTFTDLLGRKAQLVSSDLLDPGVNDIGRPHRVVTSEELVQLISHAST